MKRLLPIIFFLSIFLFSKTALAGMNWKIDCSNDSCAAAAGGLKVEWSSPDNYLSLAKLTGVSGLPLNVKRVKNTETALNTAYQATVKKDASILQGMPVDHMLQFNNNASYGVSKDVGLKLSSVVGNNVDVNLDAKLVRFIAIHVYGEPSEAYYYVKAAQKLLSLYYVGHIRSVVSLFLLYKNNIALNDFGLTHPDKLSSILILSKFYAYLEYPDSKNKYKKAYLSLFKLFYYKNDKAVANIVKSYNSIFKTLNAFDKTPFYELAGKSGFMKFVALKKFYKKGGFVENAYLREILHPYKPQNSLELHMLNAEYLSAKTKALKKSKERINKEHFYFVLKVVLFIFIALAVVITSIFAMRKILKKEVKNK